MSALGSGWVALSSTRRYLVKTKKLWFRVCACGALLLLEKSGKARGRGERWQRAWFIFEMHIYEYKEKSCQRHTCQSPNAARAASPERTSCNLGKSTEWNIRRPVRQKPVPEITGYTLLLGIRTWEFEWIERLTIAAKPNLKTKRQTLTQAVSDIRP